MNAFPVSFSSESQLNDWRLMALAALSEGFCPGHEVPLDLQPRGGWCGKCNSARGGIWRTVDGGDTVIATYGTPEEAWWSWGAT